MTADRSQRGHDQGVDVQSGEYLLTAEHRILDLASASGASYFRILESIQRKSFLSELLVTGQSSEGTPSDYRAATEAAVRDMRADSHVLRQLQHAIQLSSHILSRDRSQLFTQLYARLMVCEASPFQSFLTRNISKLNGHRPWWLRLLSPTLATVDGPLLRTVVPYPRPNPHRAAITSDGRRAVLMSKDRVDMWDLEAGIHLHIVRGPHGDSMNITPDGRRAVFRGRYYGQMEVWDLERRIRLCEICPGGVATLTSDGRYVIYITGEYKPRLEQRPVSRISSHQRPETSESSEKQDIFDEPAGILKVVDLESDKVVGSFSTGLACRLEATPDGRRAVMVQGGGIKVWDLEGGILKWASAYDGRNILSVDVSTDGRRLTLISRDATTRSCEVTRDVRNLETGLVELSSSWTHSPHTASNDRFSIKRFTVCPNGKRVLEGEKDGHTVQHIIDLGCAGVTPDGRRAISISSGRMKVWDVENVDETHYISEGHRSGVYSVAVTPDGSRAISGSEDNVIVWDVETGSRLYSMYTRAPHLRPLRRPNPIARILVSPDGHHAVLRHRDGTLTVWNLDTLQVTYLCDVGARFYHDVAFTPDSHSLVTVSSDIGDGIYRFHHALRGGNLSPIFRDSKKSLQIWDVKSCLSRGALTENDDRIGGYIKVAPDGRRMVSFSQFSHSTIVWDLQTGAELCSIPIRHVRQNGVALTLDGRRLVSVWQSGSSPDRKQSWDTRQSLKVWDTTDGSDLFTFQVVTMEITAVTVSPDGHHTVYSAESGGFQREHKLHICNLDSGIEFCPLMDSLGTGYPFFLEISRDGQRAITSDWQGVKVWDIARRGLLASFSADAPLLSCGLAQDGKTIVLGDESGQVHFLRLESGYDTVGAAQHRSDIYHATRTLSEIGDVLDRVTEYSDSLKSMLLKVRDPEWACADDLLRKCRHLRKNALSSRQRLVRSRADTELRAALATLYRELSDGLMSIRKWAEGRFQGAPTHKRMDKITHSIDEAGQLCRDILSSLPGCPDSSEHK